MGAKGAKGCVRIVAGEARLGVVYSLVERKMLADQQLTADAGAEELVEVLVDVLVFVVPVTIQKSRRGTEFGSLLTLATMNTVTEQTFSWYDGTPQLPPSPALGRRLRF
eukprot:2119842-Pyramimonas_sp.AAC.1